MKSPTDSNKAVSDFEVVEPVAKKRPYATPRLDRKRAVERVTLLSGMGAMSVGVINVMN